MTATAPAPRSTSNRNSSAKPPQEIVKTWAFDSVGNRKYALQIKKASNGNPCLKIVEGVPSKEAEGTFRKFDITIWSEDFERLFATLDEVRSYMKEHNIKTPEGHKFDPNKPPRRRSGSAGGKRRFEGTAVRNKNG
jgi:hypothetical protein